jgi:TP901 family phage tail tape measure protein
MANNAFTVALTLMAFDRMSSVIHGATGKALTDFTRLQEKSKQAAESLAHFGRQATALGFGTVGALQRPVQAFADLEDASTRLQMTLMKSTGAVSEHFGRIDALAMSLGNRLPGTTADFQSMFAKLIQLGITEQSLLGGVGEAAAYLGVVLKRPYEETAEVAAKLKEATGIADQDMLGFIDTIQRTAHLGVDLREMETAFSRSAGALKLAGYQGLETSKSMAAIYAMLIKTGLGGERAGTNFAALMNTLADSAKLEKANELAAEFGVTLSMLDRTGRLVGPEQLIRQLEQLHALPPPAQHEILKALFGPGMDMQEAAILMTKGVAGYREMTVRMAEQADLTQRTALVLGTLRNLWDAATGTFTNALASFAGTFAPELKRLTDWFGDLSARLDAWVKTHQTLARWAGLGAVALAGAAFAVGALGLALSGLAHVASAALSGLGLLGRGFGVLTASASSAWAALLRLVSAQVALQGQQLALFPTTQSTLSLLRTWIGLQADRLKAALLESGQALARWTVAQWASARATLFSLSWWKAQAVTMGTTLTSAIARATTALIGWTTATWGWIRANVFSLSGLGHLAKAAGSGMVSALKAAALATWGATQATLAWTRALLANPLTWVAVAALLIWKFWQPLANFFLGFWRGLREGAAEFAPAFAPLLPLFRGLGTVLAWVLTPLRWLWNLLTWIVAPVEGLGSAGDALGVRWGRGVMRMLAALVDLPVRFLAAGAKIMESLWQGMMSKITKPYEAVKGLAGRIRALLPSSPAKEGPLKDLHRIRLIETIAETVRPAPLVSALSRTLAATALVTPLLAPGAVGAGLAGPRAIDSGAVIRAAASGAPAGAGSAITIHYAPTITIGPGAPAGAGALRDTLHGQMRQDVDDLVRLIEEAQRRRARGNY